jgi:hypothetical protein
MLSPCCLKQLAGRTLPCSGLVLLLAVNTAKSSILTKTDIFLHEDLRKNVIFCPASRFLTKPSFNLSLIDPDDLVLSGPARRKALEQLQASVDGCLILDLDEATGKVSLRRVNKPNSRRHRPLTIQGKRLDTVIEDHSIIVRITANDSMETTLPPDLMGRPGRKGFSVGGSYLGNTFTGTMGYAPDDAFNPVKAVAGNQVVHPEITGMISEYYQKPGADMLHEVTESYAGAQYAQKARFADTTAELYYLRAHMDGPLIERYLDSLKREIALSDSTKSKVFFVDILVKSDSAAEKNIWRLYKSDKKIP